MAEEELDVEERPRVLRMQQEWYATQRKGRLGCSVTVSFD